MPAEDPEVRVDGDPPEAGPSSSNAAAPRDADEGEPPIISCLTAELLAEDQSLRSSYPIAIDLSTPRFQIASVGVGLAAVRESVLRELNLADNALASLDGISRFGALRVLKAPRNRLREATLRCPRLTLLDLSANTLGALPLLHGCASLLARTS